MSKFYTLTNDELRTLDDHAGNLRRPIVRRDVTESLDQVSSLFIGLGGMGLRTITQLKQTLRAQIQAQRHHRIRFLAIDTDQHDLYRAIESGDLAEEETFLLFNQNLAHVMRHPEDMPSAIRNILPDQPLLSIPAAANLNGSGACQIRLLGRASLMEETLFQELCHRLHDLIISMDEFYDHPLEVHIVAGLCGGTGGGLCIDLPYILRRILRRMRFPTDQVQIHGHLYLPDVFDGLVERHREPLYRNGYAALKEIDYYMNIEENGETFDAEYPDGPYSSGKNLFHSCTLVGGRGPTPLLAHPSYDRALRSCVEDLVYQATPTVANVHAFIGNIALQMHYNPHRPELGFHEGGSYKYTCVGTASLSFPADTIAQYLISLHLQEILLHMQSLGQRADQPHVDDLFYRILKKHRGSDDLELILFSLLSPSQFLEEYWRKFIYHTHSDLDPGKYSREMIANGQLQRDLKERACGLLLDFSQKTDPHALCDTACILAEEIFRNPRKGPYYLAQLLHGRTETHGFAGLFERIEGYIALCRQELPRLNHCRAQLHEELPHILATMQKPLQYRRHLQYYMDAALELAKTELIIALYEQLAVSLSKTLDLLQDTLNRRFLRYTDTLTALHQTIAQNAERCHREIFEELPQDSILSINDHRLEPLKALALRYAAQISTNVVWTCYDQLCLLLTGDMVNQPERWTIERCADTLCALISNFPDFQPILDRTWWDYMDDAYGTASYNEQKELIEFIEGQLDARSVPLFDLSDDLSWNDIRQMNTRFLRLPGNVGTAWGSLFTGTHQTISMSPDPNVISSYIRYEAIPLWLHRNMIHYEQCYEGSHAAGIHINENPQHAPAYMDYPPVIPIQQWHRFHQGPLLYKNPRESAFRAALEDRLAEAEKWGILVCNGENTYEIHLLQVRPEGSKLDRFLQDYKKSSPEMNLWLAMGNAWGTVCHTLPGTTPAEVAELLRKRPKLAECIRQELHYLKQVLDLLHPAPEKAPAPQPEDHLSRGR